MAGIKAALNVTPKKRGRPRKVPLPVPVPATPDIAAWASPKEPPPFVKKLPPINHKAVAAAELKGVPPIPTPPPPPPPPPPMTTDAAPQEPAAEVSPLWVGNKTEYILALDAEMLALVRDLQEQIERQMGFQPSIKQVIQHIMRTMTDLSHGSRDSVA